ncbi:hypothetical protein SCLCIDRAFT_1211143 [Scleroderma citrinum Foug A]|uniref:Uncharacterized protein n=1 Tax=Scleroderma citrinum Foug A TaxID=1036808 RepID=A0A0C3EDK0_9AGAM|nr:hypothetical protein SCLCIDRAFT_1211143 [Scleroderma citrinum Foug A]
MLIGQTFEGQFKSTRQTICHGRLDTRIVQVRNFGICTQLEQHMHANLDEEVLPCRTTTKSPSTT